VDSKLALFCGSPRHLQPGNIGTCDQQNQGNGNQQHAEWLAQAAANELGKRHGEHAPA
jgi:hypothetical protein